MPLPQFFKEPLLSVSVVRNGKDASFDLRRKDEGCNLSMYINNGRYAHASLLHQMSVVCASCSAAQQSFGGFQFLAKAVKTRLVGSADIQVGNPLSQESFITLILGMPEGLQTPGFDCQIVHGDGTQNL